MSVAAFYVFHVSAAVRTVRNTFCFQALSVCVITN